MALVCGCGSSNYKSWPTNLALKSRSITCRPAQAVESTTGAVAVGREGSCFPAAFVLPVPHWFGPLLRFQSPLVKPDMQISRIRLSPASSGLRARPVRAAPRQGVQAECLVEILVRILAVSGARLSAASRQPSLKTPLDIPLHQPVGRKDRPLVEILGPAAEQPIDSGNP